MALISRSRNVIVMITVLVDVVFGTTMVVVSAQCNVVYSSFVTSTNLSFTGKLIQYIATAYISVSPNMSRLEVIALKLMLVKVSQTTSVGFYYPVPVT